MNINLRKIFKKYKIIIVFSVIVAISSIYFLLNKDNFKEGFNANDASKRNTPRDGNVVINYAYFYEPSEKNSPDAGGVLGKVDGTIESSPGVDSDNNNLDLFNRHIVFNYGTIKGQSFTHEKIIWEAGTVSTYFETYQRFKDVKGGDWRNDIIFNDEVQKDDLNKEFLKFEETIEKQIQESDKNLKIWKLPNQYDNITYVDLLNKYKKSEVNEETKIIYIDTNNDFNKSSPIKLKYFDSTNALYDKIKNEIITDRNEQESKYYWYKKKSKIIGPLTKNDLTTHFIKKKLQDHHIVYRSTGDSNKLNAIDKQNGKRLREIGMQYLTEDTTTDANANMIDSKIIETGGGDNDNLYTDLNKQVHEKRKSTAWMYDDSPNKRDTITDLNHPYFGSYKNVTKNECVDNEGNCNKNGLYPNGKKCLFEENSWGFEDKNICYPLSCKDDYNPNKRCKVKYNNRDIPKCFNDFQCDARGTIATGPQCETAKTYLRRVIGMKDSRYNKQFSEWFKKYGDFYVNYVKNNSPHKELICASDSNQQNYSKQFLFKGKTTNVDRLYPKDNIKCKCDCKPGWYGDDCSMKYEIGNQCAGATDVAACTKPETQLPTIEPTSPTTLIIITVGILVIVTIAVLAYFGVFEKIAAASSAVKAKIDPKIAKIVLIVLLIIGAYLMKRFLLDN